MTVLSHDSLWRRFVWCFAGTALVLAGVLYAFVLVMDPYGLQASASRPPTPIMDVNQRFMYPQLIRSGRFDSAVFGTSTVRLLDPKQLNAAFGGRFANLGMNAATPWEQMQLASLFLRSVPESKNLILGLDRTWCEEDADKKKLTFRAFPPWLYDDSRLNDYPELLSLTGLEIAGRVLLHRLGSMPERIPADGYEVFVPDDATYDLERARFHLNQWQLPVAPKKAFRISPDGQRKVVFPALPWLQELLSQVPASTTVTLVFTPNHIRAQAVPGTRDAAIEAACKTQLTDLAKEKGAALIDFRFRSSVTENDANYWDPLHYRIGIAHRIVESLKDARATGKGDAAGFYKVLNPPRP
ncbi:hypothetical protein [Microvirga flavescens]|uniref:hypothetical protein n=1 Tax=Microvirga flavescens TaxID=2249811 RepID=UPI000DD5B89D|nr:hypothetical protein [Microvirga flavescens]